ncbi:MAG TPA: DPP IV N-terminal domain-containing protein [Bryobacteraceae bacterium]|nr:DPP IV N-terminal domain-containing protein [Bryobacteraceae bacterium]
MKKFFWLLPIALPLLLVLARQDSSAQDIKGIITETGRVAIALPDLRGSGAAQNWMQAFNDTLWGDISSSGVVKMVPKTMYPTTVPQQPSDFREPPPPTPEPTRGRRHKQTELVTPPTGGGLWISDWSGPPVNANYLAFGYTAVQNDVLVLSGWLYDLSRGTPANAQVLGKRYLASVDEAGARRVAHEFAADILMLLGGKSLYGTRIVFVSNRTAAHNKEIWMMDPDGSNQRQITHYNSLSIEPAISPDGSKIAFASYAKGNPGIFIFSVDPVRQLPFYNQRASVNETPEFTPDGKQILYSSSASGWAQIYIANLDGSGLKRLSSSAAIEVEPKVNPKTGTEIAFVSGRSGPQQIYRMNIDGGDVERLTNGEGEASNPSWNPDGVHLAFSWTRGFAAGNWNIFVMDVASRNLVQLTHSEGRNENPSWAPDGVHIVFQSTRSGTPQIYSMLADGTQVKQLTTQGSNWSPVWGK